jgi:hypothetical protein
MSMETESGSEMFRLPELREGLLDREGLEALFSDIASETELLGVSVKGGLTAYATDEEISLFGARDWLMDGKALGIQLRYRHRGVEWWDTLIRTPLGVKLIRIRHQLGC